MLLVNTPQSDNREEDCAYDPQGWLHHIWIVQPLSNALVPELRDRVSGLDVRGIRIFLYPCGDDHNLNLNQIRPCLAPCLITVTTPVQRRLSCAILTPSSSPSLFHARMFQRSNSRLNPVASNLRWAKSALLSSCLWARWQQQMCQIDSQQACPRLLRTLESLQFV